MVLTDDKISAYNVISRSSGRNRSGELEVQSWLPRAVASSHDGDESQSKAVDSLGIQTVYLAG